MEELRANDVEIYTFPTDDETVADVNKEMNEMMPFAGTCQQFLYHFHFHIRRSFSTVTISSRNAI